MHHGRSRAKTRFSTSNLHSVAHIYVETGIIQKRDNELMKRFHNICYWYWPPPLPHTVSLSARKNLCTVETPPKTLFKSRHRFGNIAMNVFLFTMGIRQSILKAFYDIIVYAWRYESLNVNFFPIYLFSLGKIRLLANHIWPTQLTCQIL